MLTIITLTLQDSITTALSGVTHSIAVVMGVYDKGVRDSEPPNLPGTLETSVVTRQFADDGQLGPPKVPLEAGSWDQAFSGFLSIPFLVKPVQIAPASVTWQNTVIHP